MSLRSVHLWIPVNFKGTYSLDQTLPAVWQERAKRKLLQMWHETEFAQYFGNVDICLYDYYCHRSAIANITPDLLDPQVMYDVVGFLDDDTIMLLIMKYNAKLQPPQLPCFK